jgi:hypothetical protein
MRRLLRALRALVRSFAGENSAFEKFFRVRYKRLVLRAEHQTDSSFEQSTRRVLATTRFRLTNDYTSRNWTVFQRGKSTRRLGIYMLGSCDLPAVFAAKPMIAARLDGICCIIRDGEVAEARSDLLLQTLSPIDPALYRLAIQRLRLPADAFEPRLFQSSFRLRDLPNLGDFPKSVTVLSIGADVSRTLYRHKEHGYLIDPGGYWLRQNLTNVTANPRRAEWVRENFTSVGTLTADEFKTHFGKVLSILTEAGTQVVVFNMAVVSPGDLGYSYQFRRNPQAIRRMEFNDALADLAGVHGVSVLNVDRILKREGIQDQVDFAHFPLERMVPIAREFHRILVERELV